MSFRANDSLAEQIAHHVGELIISGELVEGERIQEMRIAGELDVSRGAVREALLILQRRHLITIFPRRGAVVTELSPASLKSLYELLILHYSLIVRRISVLWHQSNLPPSMTALAEMEEALSSQDIERFYERGYELLRLAQPFAGNPYLDAILADLQPSARRASYLALQVSRREMEEAFGFLKGLLDAIMLRQSERAVELLEEYLLHQRNLVLESLLRVKQIEMAWARRHRR